MFIFMDLDGTLLDHKSGKLSKKTIVALTAAREKGHKLFINTGRPIFRMNQLETTLFDGVICYSGGYVAVGEKVLYRQPMSKQQTEEVVEHCRRIGIDLALLGERRAYYSGSAYGYFLQIPEGRFVGDSVPCLNEQFHEYRQDYIYKASPYVLNEEEILQLKHAVGKSYVIVSGSSTPDGLVRRYELTLSGVNKWTGIERVLEYYGASPGQTVGIGDNWNDREMIQNCGIGIAMGNAAEEIQKTADFVTESSERDGIYHAFQRLEIV